MIEREPFRTKEVDLAAYLELQGHICKKVVMDRERGLGEFEFMWSPGLEKQVNRWLNGGEPELKKFANARVRLYRWARDVVREQRR